jgi:hypothetical protein
MNSVDGIRPLARGTLARRTDARETFARWTLARGGHLLARHLLGGQLPAGHLLATIENGHLPAGLLPVSNTCPQNKNRCLFIKFNIYSFNNVRKTS